MASLGHKKAPGEPDKLRRAGGSDRNGDHELAAGFAVDHGAKVFVLAAGASTESLPDTAVESLVDQVAAQVGQLVGVFGELEGAAVDGGGHGWWWVVAGSLPPVPIL